MSQPPARHVKSLVTERRLGRQWSAIEARLDKLPRRWALGTWGRTPALVLVAVLALYILARPGRAPVVAPMAGVAFESGEGKAPSLVLSDGSRVDLMPESRFEVASLRADLVRIELVRGGVDVAVKHTPGRELVIEAAGVQVHDVGTRFRVELRGDMSVHVSVQEGEVSITRPDDERASSVRAGETWWSATPPPPPAVSAAPSEVEGEPDAAANEPAPPATAPVVDPLTRVEALAKAHKPSEAYDVLGPAGFQRAVLKAGPSDLFMLADVARQSSHPKDAESAFDALRKRYRGDAHAGLAAYEVGRLRFDSLGDPAGAVEALADAVALSPDAPFREDAESRRVDALDAMHDPSCSAVRASFLTRYPSSLHAPSVTKRCGGK